MQTGRATGWHIAFFTFALLLLAVPLSRWISGLLPWSAPDRDLIETAVPFVVGAVLLLAISPLRNCARSVLARPIPTRYRKEVLAVAALSPLIGFAAVGALMLSWWMHEGPAGLAQHVAAMKSHDWNMARAMLPADMARILLIGVLLAPVLEELVFRGFLYRTWAEQWGWLGAMLLSSLLFALYHDVAWHAFLLSLVQVCLYRRTGSLWAPIAVHAFYNLSMWYPLLGRHVFGRFAQPAGEISAWSFHVTSLVLALIAVSVYAWMSRDVALAGRAERHAGMAHEPLPQ